ncbi:MAG: M23 family metallopeptidase [Ruminococcaceae bacterium]|nr:M23 family metallopeptidase [Oscillospiraceae bacterium]
MEENEIETKRKQRIIYLSVAVALAVIAIIIIATTVANKSPNEPIDTSSDTATDDEQTNLPNSDTLPTFSLPVSGNISMDFSDSVPVFSQTMNDYRTHLGVDLSANLGDEVLAVADGVVTNVWDDPFMGKCVSIEHSGNAVSIYKNLDPEVNDGIIIGASVKSGDIIGAVGESAMNEIAEEPHLHYELKVNGTHVDPKKHFKFPGQKDESTDSSTESNQ